MSNKAIARQIILGEIEMRGEGLLDDDGVDHKVARSIADSILLELQRQNLLVDRNQAPKHYLEVIAGDTDAEILGPFASDEERDKAAQAHRKGDPEKEDGIYPLDINSRGELKIGYYEGGDLDEEEPELVGESEGVT